jgi:hypothetical protein
MVRVTLGGFHERFWEVAAAYGGEGGSACTGLQAYHLLGGVSNLRKRPYLFGMIKRQGQEGDMDKGKDQNKDKDKDRDMDFAKFFQGPIRDNCP